MARICGIIFALLLMSSAYAQDIKIVVKDRSNSQPVSFVYVNLYHGDTLKSTVQTGDNGIALVHAQQYPCTIEIVGSGYETALRLLSQYPVNGLLTVDFSKKIGKLDELVVTGLAQPVKMKDALSVYQVISRAMIQAQGAVTLDEALKNQLNIRISSDNILGQSVGMQGMTGEKVKVLIDGLPVNGREAGNINIGQLNMNNVERIEMIQGPMSVVYGTDALGGVINVITRKENKDLALNAGTYYESVGKFNADATATLSLNNRQTLTLGGGRNYFEGWKYIDQHLTYQAETLNYNRVLLFKPKEQFIGNLAYNYTAPSGFNFNLASDFLKEKVTNRGQLQIWDPFLGCYAFDEYYHTMRLLNRLTMNGKLGKTGKWQTQAGYAVYFREREKVRKNMVTLNEIPTGGQGDQDTSRFNDVTLRSSYTNTFKKITYTAGYDINLQDARSTKLNNSKQEIQDYALYANVSVPLAGDKLVTQLGVRGAYNSVYHPPVIPSLNLLYKPLEKLQLRGSYTQGFRAPSLKEMYLSFIDQNHYIIGNTNLAAEKSNHGQVSASYQVYKNEGDYLQFILTGYYNDVYNGIVLVPINPDDTNSIEYMYSNLRHQQNTIGTAQADGQWRDFHYQLGYSYRYTFNEEGVYNGFGAYEATAVLQYALPKWDANLNLFYKFTGKQPFLQPSIDGSAYYNGSQSAFHVLDGSVEKKFWNRKLQLIIGGKNLFNITQLRGTASGNSGSHGTGGISGGFLPRSFFTSLRLTVGN